MNIPLALCSLVLLFVASDSAVPQVRYINSIPQFGSSAFTAAMPPTPMFPSIAPAAVSSYSDLAAGSWNFFATFGKKVSAGSDQYETSDDNWYTAFTAQQAQRKLKNFLIADQTTSPSTSHASVRTVNLLQYNFPINTTATNLANTTRVHWTNVNYSVATPYTLVSPGNYYIDTFSSSLKRNVEQNNCTSNCGGHWFFAVKKSYTVYVLPTTTIVTVDGIRSSSKRGLRSRRAVRKSLPLAERLVEKEEEGEKEKEKEVDEDDAREEAAADPVQL